MGRSLFAAAACLAGLVFAAPAALAQTDTPLLPETEAKLPEACRTAVPTLVDNLCDNRGALDTIVLNFPAICQQYGLEAETRAALERCAANNVFTEGWRRRLGMDNAFPAAFAEMVGRYSGLDGDDVSVMVAASEAFRLGVIGCGRDAACHRELLDALPAPVRARFVALPFHCDFGPPPARFDDGGYAHMFFDERYPDGIGQPMCRAYFCSKRDCAGVPDTNATPFVLSDVFKSQYDLLYKAVAPR